MGVISSSSSSSSRSSSCGTIVVLVVVTAAAVVVAFSSVWRQDSSPAVSQIKAIGDLNLLCCCQLAFWDKRTPPPIPSSPSTLGQGKNQRRRYLPSHIDTLVQSCLCDRVGWSLRDSHWVRLRKLSTLACAYYDLPGPAKSHFRQVGHLSGACDNSRKEKEILWPRQVCTAKARWVAWTEATSTLQTGYGSSRRRPRRGFPVPRRTRKWRRWQRKATVVLARTRSVTGRCGGTCWLRAWLHFFWWPSSVPSPYTGIQLTRGMFSRRGSAWDSSSPSWPGLWGTLAGLIWTLPWLWPWPCCFAYLLSKVNGVYYGTCCFAYLLSKVNGVYYGTCCFAYLLSKVNGVNYGTCCFAYLLSKANGEYELQ